MSIVQLYADFFTAAKIRRTILTLQSSCLPFKKTARGILEMPHGHLYTETFPNLRRTCLLFKETRLLILQMIDPTAISYHPTLETVLFGEVSKLAIPRETLKRVLLLCCGPYKMQAMTPEAKLRLISRWSTPTILVDYAKEWAVRRPKERLKLPRMLLDLQLLALDLSLIIRHGRTVTAVDCQASEVY
jgi:hypothetical protein